MSVGGEGFDDAELLIRRLGILKIRQEGATSNLQVVLAWLVEGHLHVLARSLV